MKTAADCLVGTHDFASFQAAGSERKSTVRILSQLKLSESTGPIFGYLDVTMTSNGFLYNMVRNIVGTLVAVGQGSREPEWVQWVLEQRDRKHAGQTAPAHALFLANVEYPATLN